MNKKYIINFQNILVKLEKQNMYTK